MSLFPKSDKTATTEEWISPRKVLEQTLTDATEALREAKNIRDGIRNRKTALEAQLRAANQEVKERVAGGATQSQIASAQADYQKLLEEYSAVNIEIDQVGEQGVATAQLYVKRAVIERDAFNDKVDMVR